MKKTIALILTLCTLLCTLTACKSCRSKYLPEDTDTETDTSTEKPEEKAYIHGDNPYAGLTQKQLVDLYFDNYRVNIWGNTDYNTPYYYITSSGNGMQAFSKLTGDMVTLCKDPLCDHSNCLFSKPFSGLVVSENRIFTIQPTDDGGCLLSFNYEFNDAKKLLTWSYKDDTPIGGYIFYWNEKIYYRAHYRLNGETIVRVRVFDVASETESWLEPEETIHFDNMRAVYEGYLYYLRTGSGSIWRYDLSTGEDICVLSESILNRETGDLGLQLRSVEPGSRILYITITRPDGDSTSFNPYYYYLDTEELKPAVGAEYRVGAYGISVKDHIYDDAFKSDPFYSLYVNDFVKDPGKVRSRYGGDLYYSTIGDNEQKHLLRINLDGIPVAIESDVGNYINSDGRCLYLRIKTYKGYKNEYNPDFKAMSGRAQGQISDSQVPVYSHWGWLVIDVENQKALTICQDDVEYEWYPEFDWYTDGNN